MPINSIQAQQLESDDSLRLLLDVCTEYKKAIVVLHAECPNFQWLLAARFVLRRAGVPLFRPFTYGLEEEQRNERLEAFENASRGILLCGANNLIGWRVKSTNTIVFFGFPDNYSYQRSFLQGSRRVSSPHVVFINQNNEIKDTLCMRLTGFFVEPVVVVNRTNPGAVPIGSVAAIDPDGNIIITI
jgi:hypothetical protein